MLTIFTIPKPFRGNINIIQRNAIQSWLWLRPKCEIILFGDDEGVAEGAKELGVFHIPEIEKNEFGTPFLSSAFNLAQKIAKNQILVYINADIILMSDFIPAIQKIDKPLFLMSGQRYDLDIKQPIQFDEIDWEQKLKDDIKKEGKLHGYSGIDYFIFSRHLPYNLPPFAVGRPGWDNWLIYHMRSMKTPVIDATEIITAVHQNHRSVYHFRGEETQRNLKLTGGYSQMCTLRDADWILTRKNLKKPPFPRRVFAELALFYPWRLILSLKRKMQQFLS